MAAVKEGQREKVERISEEEGRRIGGGCVCMCMCTLYVGGGGGGGGGGEKGRRWEEGRYTV